MIRSLSPIQRNQSIPSPMTMEVIKSYFQMSDELDTLKRDFITKSEEISSEFNSKIEEAKRVIEETHSLQEQIKVIKKGDKGEQGIQGIQGERGSQGEQGIQGERGLNGVNGKDGLNGKDGANGKDAVIDYKKILKSVVIPKPKDGRNADERMVVEKILKTLSKKKIHIDDIDGFKEGLEQTISPIRNLAAGFRGGGDTVVAGSGVSIANDGNGKKVIATTLLGIKPQVPTGVINGVNRTFTCIGVVAVVFVDGVIDTTALIVGAVNSTITCSIPPLNDIYAF